MIPHLMGSLGSHSPGLMEHPTLALQDLITWVHLQWGHRDHHTWGHKDHLTWGLPLITLQWCTQV